MRWKPIPNALDGLKWRGLVEGYEEGNRAGKYRLARCNGLVAEQDSMN